MFPKRHDGMRRKVTRAGRSLILTALASAALAVPVTAANAMPDGGYGSLKDYVVTEGPIDRYVDGEWRIYETRQYTSGPNSGKTCYGFIRLADGGTVWVESLCSK
jgi:hypothetical protein